MLAPLLQKNVYVSVRINLFIVVSVQYYGTFQVASYRITSVECKRHAAISSGKLDEVIIYIFLNSTP